MLDTVGEKRPGYKTVDQRTSGPVPLRDQKSFRAAVASFAASLGVLWGTVTGHDPIGKTQEGIQDAASTTQNIATGVKNETVEGYDKAMRDVMGQPLEGPANKR